MSYDALLSRLYGHENTELIKVKCLKFSVLCVDLGFENMNKNSNKQELQQIQVSGLLFINYMRL